MVFFATIWAVAVFCGGPTGDYYIPATKQIVLDRPTCQSLQRAPQVSKRPYENAMNVFTLAHEEGHAHDPDTSFRKCGVIGPCENYADCYAAGHMVALALTLGYTGYWARQFKRQVHAWRAFAGYTVIPQRCFQ
jgi:hypothetical protein